MHFILIGLDSIVERRLRPAARKQSTCIVGAMIDSLIFVFVSKCVAIANSCSRFLEVLRHKLVRFIDFLTTDDIVQCN